MLEVHKVENQVGRQVEGVLSQVQSCVPNLRNIYQY